MNRTSKWFSPSFGRRSGQVVQGREAARVRRRHWFRPEVPGLEARRLLSFAPPSYTLSTIVSFNGHDGQYPEPGTLVTDSQGDVFGTTDDGGGVVGNSFGNIFEISAKTHTLTVLATFDDTDGESPVGQLVLDSQGNLYGFTEFGGEFFNGVVYELPKGSHTIKVLASVDGSFGFGIQGLAVDSHGNVFGTTLGSGAGENNGTIFEIPAGTTTVQVVATFGGDGLPSAAVGGPQAVPTSQPAAFPKGDIFVDSHDNIYGTSDDGGNQGDGTVWEWSPGSTTIQTLASFPNDDGFTPLAGAMDGQGNIYGTAQGGANGDGTVWEWSPGSTTIQLLGAFDGTNGQTPQLGLVVDGNGDVFGTTLAGGPTFNPNEVTNAAGVAFEIPANSFTIDDIGTFTFGNGPVPTSPAEPGSLALTPGGNLIGTSFEGGSFNDGTVFELATNIDETSVDLEGSANPGYGQLENLVATVTNLTNSDPITGTVSFFNGSRLVATVPVSTTLEGTVALDSTSTLAASATPYAFTAVYSGAGKIASATSNTFDVTVSPALTETSLTDLATGPVSYGTPVTLTATVVNTVSSVAPRGAVQFFDGTSYVTAAALVPQSFPTNVSVASVTVILPATGAPAPLTANYVGQPNFAASSSSFGSPVLQEVDPAQTSTALNLSASSITYGQPVTFTATVTNTATAAAPIGTVKFYNGTTLLGAALVESGGVATLTRTNLAAGTDSITATYDGTANFASSSASPAVPLSIAQAGTTATLSSPTGPTEYGQPVTFDVSVSNTSSTPVPNGSVTFYLDYGTASQKTLGSAPLAAGAATFTTKPTALPAGDDAVTAVYNGTVDFQPATSNAITQSVSLANTSTTLGSSASGTVSAGTAVSFVAAVTDPDTGLVPTGMVQFWNGTTLITTLPLNAEGQATLTRTLAAGSYTIEAVYVGTTNFNTSTSNTVSLTVT